MPVDGLPRKNRARVFRQIASIADAFPSACWLSSIHWPGVDGSAIVPPMQRFRSHSAPAAWLILVAIILGGGLIATHSHDGLTSGELSSVARCDGHGLPGTTEHIKSATPTEVELCLICTAGQRQGALDTSHPSLRSPVMVARGVRAANGLTISGCAALPPAPRGPPKV